MPVLLKRVMLKLMAVKFNKDVVVNSILHKYYYTALAPEHIVQQTNNKFLSQRFCLHSNKQEFVTEKIY